MAKTIMVQGTASNAGKSFLVAGLCRIFREDGLRVAPFKSQNMALNSYVTKDGLEMGRAQAMQAEAAGIEPSARMNPVLLKPTGDMGSQVIVNGSPVGHMKARDYYAFKHTLRPVIQAAFDSLAAQHDVIVLEGAGSPAEINLKQDDFVNMGMARMADAPVLLVGDIDPGGVFASLYGTLALLETQERARVKATVINKFRGDVTILTPGLHQLETLTGVPVLGVVPYMRLDLEDEDSLSDRLTRDTMPQMIDIAVIRLPRLSNFTDFHPLQGLEDISLRYVDSARKLGRPDLIILPGTKSTMDDLDWLKRQGLAERVVRHAREGHPILGICGGLQMLGQTILDPCGVERGGAMEGLGLLPAATTFSRKKTKSQTQGVLPSLSGVFSALSGMAYEGYEIHMGQTEGALQRGNVWGTYVHGLFDRAQIVEGLVGALCAHKGLAPLPVKALDFKAYKERQYDLLAKGLREALDLRLLYEILDRGHTP